MYWSNAWIVFLEHNSSVYERQPYDSKGNYARFFERNVIYLRSVSERDNDFLERYDSPQMIGATIGIFSLFNEMNLFFPELLWFSVI